MKTSDRKYSSHGPSLLIEEGFLPRIVEHVEGAATELNAIGMAIVEAGYSGVSIRGLTGAHIIWQMELDTPEGVYFAGMCQGAERGKSLPSPEQVLALIRPFLTSIEGWKK